MARAFVARWSGIAAALADTGVVGPECTVLDIGTGPTGAFARAAADELGITALAIDAKDRGWAPHPQIEWRHQSLRPRDVRELGRYDAVLALSVLHHTRHWARMLDAMRHAARSIVIVEVPQPDERLTTADARADLQQLYDAVASASVGVIARSGATRQRQLVREVHVLPPLLTGYIVKGGGHHARNSANLAEEFEAELGWRPFPGSLNVRVGHGTDLITRPAGVVMREREIGPDRRYRLWHARLLDAPDIPAALMACRDMPQGRAVEVLAPVRLRDVLREKAPVRLEVLPTEVRSWT